jgi:hypothetical protein
MTYFSETVVYYPKERTNMEIMLVVTSLDDPKRLKPFERILKRKTKNMMEVFPGTWIVTSTKYKAHDLANSLDSFFQWKDEKTKSTPINERLLVTTVGLDWEHFNGWVDKAFWDFVKEAQDDCKS